jgi:hypothetical protein
MAESLAKTFSRCNSYCHHLKPIKLPLQKNSSGNAKCLISLGARGQKPGKTGFGVELGGADDFVNVGVVCFC